MGVTYETIIAHVPSFISLDISVNSTGWVRKRGEQVETGIYHLNAENILERRIEFENFLEELFGDYQYDRVFIEDVIMGCNFLTTQILVLLNVCCEDLMRYNRIKTAPITRVGNTTWKKYLRLLSTRNIMGQADKNMISETMNNLGFKADVQDIYDAMGIAVSTIYSEVCQFDEGVKIDSTEKKVRPDITKGYTIVECNSYEDMMKRAKKRKRNIVEVVYDAKYRNLVEQMKSLILTTGDDTSVYAIYAPLSRIGAMCVTKGFDISKDEIYFLAYRKSVR